MKSFFAALAAILLLALVPTSLFSEPATTPDQEARARNEEEKGDLARLHQYYDVAASHYLSALRFDNQNSDLYDKLGVVEIKMRAMRPARKHFLLALKYNSVDAVAINNLGAVAYLGKKYKQAASYFKQALALNETSAAAHLNLAEAWVGLGEMDRAMTEYSRALELNADILSNNQDGIQARISTPEQRARTAFLLAKAYAKRGNLDSALEFLRRAKNGYFPNLSRVYSDQDFSALWQDPRLAKIVKR